MSVETTTGFYPAVSMRQARSWAQVPDRGARKIVALGYLPPSGLLPSQVVALRALHRLEAFPAASVDMAALRAEEITQICARCWAAPDDASYAFVSATAARALDIRNEQVSINTLVLSSRPEVYALLPVGAWCTELAMYWAGTP